MQDIEPCEEPLWLEQFEAPVPVRCRGTIHIYSCLEADSLEPRVVLVGAPSAARQTVVEILDAVESIEDIEIATDDEDGSEGALYRLAVTSESDVRAELCRAIVNSGHDLLELGRDQRELEGIFLKLVKGGASNESN